MAKQYHISKDMEYLHRLLLPFLLSFVFSTALRAQAITGPQGELFNIRLIADKLSDPWEVTYGPDQYLWVTEAKGYRVLRINPITGVKTVLLDLNNQRDFPRYDVIPDSADGGKPWPQGGLMGMALHPRLLKGQPYVFLAYLYHFAGVNEQGHGCAENFGGCYFTTRIVRYTYNSTRQKLESPVVLCDSIPGSSDHNAGRLLIAPVSNEYYLFYSVGDMGAGQFDNAGRPNHAQNIDSYEGKILRFNVYPDADSNRYNSWIPNDNPFCTADHQSAVWSYGHRNAQGLAYAFIGGNYRLYAAEHGPFSDDEINMVDAGKNYGHPLVIGYNDGNYDHLAAGVTAEASLPGPWHTSYPLINSEAANAKAMGDSYRDPIKTLYPNTNAFLNNVMTRIRNNDPEKPTWPSEAPSSVSVYTSTAIPGWKNSLLVTTLKGGKLIRLQLDATGEHVISDTINYFKGRLRYRDLAISDDGYKIYLALDSTIVSSGPTTVQPMETAKRGSVIELTYIGNTRSSNKTPADSIPIQRLDVLPRRKP
ncbi:PQQ-dependent sugar dehydrogenase [Deminuibacter soli]|uniref:Glucose/Sorbosone dehydrogenase domain-containing protein n=1 Tax=Deminuibacter soli TaxID=2291815 RepID=A0A3E1NE85_9BACT|nr:PQQ-dependent sugar dehydrogenase [Deminuibacter soli]RFM26141.1 hypothetical protein DXN05_21295 [Deminuibacter soli]